MKDECSQPRIIQVAKNLVLAGAGLVAMSCDTPSSEVVSCDLGGRMALSRIFHTLQTGIYKSWSGRRLDDLDGFFTSQAPSGNFLVQHSSMASSMT